MNPEARQPIYDVVVDRVDGGRATMERGLSKEEAEAAKNEISKLFQGARVVEHSTSVLCQENGLDKPIPHRVVAHVSIPVSH